MNTVKWFLTKWKCSQDECCNVGDEDDDCIIVGESFPNGRRKDGPTRVIHIVHCARTCNKSTCIVSIIHFSLLPGDKRSTS